VHYYQNETAGKATLAKMRELSSDDFLVQADICRVDGRRASLSQSVRSLLVAKLGGAT
jgi:hypothetical protein